GPVTLAARGRGKRSRRPHQTHQLLSQLFRRTRLDDLHVFFDFVELFLVKQRGNVKPKQQWTCLERAFRNCFNPVIQTRKATHADYWERDWLDEGEGAVPVLRGEGVRDCFVREI